MFGAILPIPQRRSLSTTRDLFECRSPPDENVTPQAFPIHKFPRLPPVIPDIPRYRTLILCFDGTGDQFDADNSNVVRLVSLLKKDDQDKQLVYYQTGIGTFTTKNRTVSRVMSQLQKILDTMFAHSIGTHIMAGYKFLMQNYKPGDRICIFGFSRGAYTARCLTGMLHKVGLLPQGNSEQVPFAYTIYRRTDEFGWQQAREFKRAFSINVNVEFLGIWDAVGSIGFKPEELPFATSTTFIKTYRHALALDEHRAKFQPNQWNEPTPAQQKLGIPDETPRPRTDVKEVWFIGCHSDVGGGSVRNFTRHSLARIPLRWMVREIFKANPGILFLTDRLPRIGLDPSTLYPRVLPRPEPLSIGKEHKIRDPRPAEMPIRYPVFMRQPMPKEPRLMPMLASEEHEELKDALSPIYDQMRLRRWWWLLEILPFPLRRVQRGLSTTSLGVNLGRSRLAEHRGHAPYYHRSVKMRMLAENGKYKPRATHKENPHYVD